jgi:nicotinamide phosphoribosyltransferase
LPAVASKKLAKGGFMVLRPDSGDPVQTVVLALRAAEKVFGCDVNSKGFKVPRGCSVIQGACRRACGVVSSWLTQRSAGDGINASTMELIIDAVHEAGFSAQSVGYGMGGGLLQKVRARGRGFRAVAAADVASR